MSIYMTEEEQIEWLKKGWKRHQNLILTVFSVILLSLSAVRYWHWHTDKTMHQASTAYEHLMLSWSQHKVKETRAYAEQLVSDYPKTAYADTARLMLATLAVNQADLNTARRLLTLVATHSKRTVLSQLARLRLARVLLAQKAYQQALDTLAALNATSYEAMANALTGDIYVAQGDAKKAQGFYQKASQQFEAEGVNSAFLDMKMNEAAAVSSR